MEVSELKEFSMYNAYATGTSYIKALFSETLLTTTNAENAIAHVKLIVDAFNGEFCSSYSKWEFIPRSNDYAFNEMLEYKDVNYLNHHLENRGYIEYNVPNCFIIRIEKDFKIIVKEYTHINCTSGSIGWISEDQARVMISRKIDHLNKSWKLN